MLSELLKAEIDIRNASSPRLAFEMSLLKASFLNDIKPLKDIMENLEEYIRKECRQPKSLGASGKARPGTCKGNKATAQELPARNRIRITPEPASPGISPEENTLTDEIRDRVLKKLDSPLASKLSKANFKLLGDKLVLTLNGGNSFFADSIKKNMGLIEKIFSEEFGKIITVGVETVKKKTIPKKDLKEQVMADPAIREVLELFDGRVVDVVPITEQKNSLATAGNKEDEMSKRMLGDIMREAQKLQAEMAEMQEEAKKKTVEATAGGGMVTVVASGAGEIISIKIEKDVVNPDDVEMLQDLIMAAVNEALRRAQEMVNSEMSKLTGGLQLPGLGNLGKLF